jgi:hypothetical protein
MSVLFPNCLQTVDQTLKSMGDTVSYQHVLDVLEEHLNRVMNKADVQRGKAWGVLEFEQMKRYGGWQSTTNVLYDRPTDNAQKYRCPLSNILLTDPVVAEDGFTYQRTAIHSYFQMLLNRK